MRDWRPRRRPVVARDLSAEPCAGVSEAIRNARVGADPRDRERFVQQCAVAESCYGELQARTARGEVRRRQLAESIEPLTVATEHSPARIHGESRMVEPHERRDGE